MSAIFEIAWKELIKKKVYTLLLLLVCIVAMNTVVTAITNTTAERYQQKTLERNLGLDMENILRLHYTQSAETQAFAEGIPMYLQYISNLNGVKAVGQFQRTGTHFEELKTMDEYIRINQILQQGRKYENHPDTSDVIFVDEPLLSLVKTGVTKYTETESGKLPIIVSEAFKDVLPIGMMLTEAQTKTIYEVIGYLPMGNHWVDENDLVRFPLESMDGCFLAPFPPKARTDILTQLSCLHNTFILTSEKADPDELKTQVEGYSISHRFHAVTASIRDEYEIYQNEINLYKTKRIALAVFICIMAVSSVISVFTTNAILKQHQYGIYLANGFTKKEIGLGILMEISLLVIPSALIVWIANLIQLATSDEIGIELFRDVLLTAHLEYTLPICLLAALAVGLVSSVLPVLKVFHDQPSDLIGGVGHGID